MRLLIIFTFVLATWLYVTQTEATFECETCQLARCKNVTKENCLAGGPKGRFEYRAQGDVCGCCPICVTILNENEDCSEVVGDKAVHKVCGPNLVCKFGKKEICVKKKSK